jgi:hypothetical protein
MIKTAQHKLFKLASVFACKLLSFGQAASPADIRTLKDAANFLLAPLDGEMFVYLGEGPLDFIKSIYRKKAFIFHPDRNSDDPTAADRSAALNKAYNKLKDCNLFELKSLLNTYFSKASSETFSTSTTEEYSPPPRKGRSSLFDPLSEEELRDFQSSMRGNKPSSYEPFASEPSRPSSSESREKPQKPRPRSGLFGGLSKEELSKIKF